MGLQQTTAPSAEPLSLADAKVHLSITGTDDDSRVTDLIPVATRYIEGATGRQFITASWTWELPWFPNAGVFAVPRPLLQSVTSIKYIDTGGDLQTLSTDVYEAGITSSPGVIALKYQQSWPATRGVINAVSIIFVAGYGDAATDVPTPLVQAIKLTVGHLNEQREATSAFRKVDVIPFGVKELIAEYQMIRVA